MIYPTPSPAEFEYPEVHLNESELGLLEWVLKSNRDSWQNARDDPNQDFREDNIHDTVYVLNKLIGRVTDLQRPGVDGGTLSINTPVKWMRSSMALCYASKAFRMVKST